MRLNVKKILLIEDDDSHAEIFQYYATDVIPDLEIVRLPDGEAALQFLRDNQHPGEACPSLIFLDLNLPKFNGHEVLRAIKAHPLAKRVPVVVFSSSGSAGEISSALSGGANSYIQKPMEPAGYRELVQKALAYWQINEGDPLLYKDN